MCSVCSQAASALAFGKEVTIQTHGYDKYKRILADVILTNGTNVNHTLVKEGWCWWYRKYAPRSRELERLEKNSRKGKNGLFDAAAQVPLWNGGSADNEPSRFTLDQHLPRQAKNGSIVSVLHNAPRCVCSVSRIASFSQ
jgi:hypothetical protein